MRWSAAAPGKVNLCLFVGRPRADGYHPLVSVVQPLSIADLVTLEPADRDEVVCDGVPGPNLAAEALAAYRAAGAELGALRLRIAKRVPVAAGMGGGSADAAAALRLAAHAAGTPDDPLIAEIAPRLGADVPSQITPGRCLMTGIGERVEPLDPGPPCGFVVVSSPHALSTPAVYREFDCQGLGRSAAELAALEDGVRAGQIPPVNDLEPAARALCPWIDGALADVRAAGAQHAMVSGSGPTVFGVFADTDAATEALGALCDRYPQAVTAEPVGPDFAAVRPA